MRLFLANGRSVFPARAILPTDTRGKPRVDDRRVISGIVHVLKSGGRWVDAPDVLWPVQNALQPVCPMGREGHMGRHLLYSGIGRRAASASPDRQFGSEGAPLCIWAAKGGMLNQAIGRSRGGRTTKIHALTDGLCRPIAFLLTGGQVADCTAGERIAASRCPRARSCTPTRATTAMPFATGRGQRGDAKHPAKG